MSELRRHWRGPVVMPLRDGTLRLSLPADCTIACRLSLSEALQLIEDLASAAMLLAYRLDVPPRPPAVTPGDPPAGELAPES